MTNEVLTINYKLDNNVPYGCLKNGHKKTYRQWQEEQKIRENPNLADIFVARPPTPPKKNVSNFNQSTNEINNTTNTTNNDDIINQQIKEQRLEIIKRKLRMIEGEEESRKKNILKELDIIEKYVKNPEESNVVLGLGDINDNDDLHATTPSIDEIIEKNEKDKFNEIEKNKHYLKKTIKRKFTLGKSNNLRRVSVLVKDGRTRKNILNTQKELKKANITDVKKYLRQHGIIKVGTTCPNDVLRKMYESALMTGEVTNTNKDILIHNFMNQDNK